MSRPVDLPCGDAVLRGHLHLPRGEGPFPAVVWNHGSERYPGTQAGLGRFYTAAGYALLVPHRRGHGDSPGRYPIDDLATTATPASVAGQVVALHERCLRDTTAVVRWLGRHPQIDAARLAMSGVSHGGVQTVLAAELDLGVKAYVPFAPAATAWDEQPLLRKRLIRAASAARRPMLVVQAANDHSLGPASCLGRSRVFPPYGKTEDGHGAFGCRGTDVWGEEVLAFLDEALPA